MQANSGPTANDSDRLAALAAKNAQLRADCLTLALRLLGENPDTFAPETAEVMHRWRPACMARLNQTDTTDRNETDLQSIPLSKGPMTWV